MTGRKRCVEGLNDLCSNSAVIVKQCPVSSVLLKE